MPIMNKFDPDQVKIELLQCFSESEDFNKHFWFDSVFVNNFEQENHEQYDLMAYGTITHPSFRSPEIILNMYIQDQQGASSFSTALHHYTKQHDLDAKDIATASDKFWTACEYKSDGTRIKERTVIATRTSLKLFHREREARSPAFSADHDTLYRLEWKNARIEQLAERKSAAPEFKIIVRWMMGITGQDIETRGTLEDIEHAALALKEMLPEEVLKRLKEIIAITRYVMSIHDILL